MNNMMSSICAFLVVFCVIANVHGSVVKRTTCDETTALNSTLKRAFLDDHNRHGSQATLEWSDSVASIAQNYANLCTTIGHSQCDAKGEMGQNLAIRINWPDVSTADVSRIVQQWADNNEPLKWASSSEVGCGMSGCAFGGSVFGPDRMIVCYYNWGGNVAGSHNPY